MLSSRVKSHMEISKIHASSQCLTTYDSAQDIYFDISFFDDRFTAKSSCDAIQNFNTSSELSGADLENYSITATLKSSQASFDGNKKLQVSENEGGSKCNNNNVDTKQQRHRRYTLLSMIKVLKNFSIALKTKSNNSETNRNISIYRQLRRTRDYVYVKGMSGLSNRVPTSSCNRCSMRNG